MPQYSQFFQHFDIMSSVRLRRVAEEQPNPKWKIQLEHFQKAVAGKNLNNSRLINFRTICFEINFGTIFFGINFRTTRTRCEWCWNGQQRRRRMGALLALKLVHTTMLVSTGTRAPSWTFFRILFDSWTKKHKIQYTVHACTMAPSYFNTSLDIWPFWDLDIVKLSSLAVRPWTLNETNNVDILDITYYQEWNLGKTGRNTLIGATFR